MAKLKVFIDTSGFVAVIYSKDQYHAKAKKLWLKLFETKSTLYTSNYILDETFTLLRQVGGVALALAFREVLANNTDKIIILSVTSVTESEAWNWFKRKLQGLSFTDSTSFALMKKLEIESAFSFDHHFVQAGFNCFS